MRCERVCEAFGPFPTCLLTSSIIGSTLFIIIFIIIIIFSFPSYRGILCKAVTQDPQRQGPPGAKQLWNWH